MVVSDKIDDAKEYFQSLTKSGRNNYQKYNYLETKDIFPTVRKVSKELGFRTKFHMDYENLFMLLIITDKEDGTTEEFHIRIPELNVGDAGKFMQDEGRIRTYAMRYLLIQAFEIAVPDEIDNKDQRKVESKKPQPKPKPQPKKAVPKKQVQQVVEPIVEPTTDEVTEQDVKEMLDKVYDIIAVKGGKEFTEAAAIWQLERICKNPQLLSACKTALKTNTADKVNSDA